MGAALIGALWYLFSSIAAPSGVRYGTVEAGTYGEHHSGSAMIVRNEIAYSADSVTTVEREAKEGDFVIANQTICYVYSSGFSAKELTTLQSYRDEIKIYQTSLVASDTANDARMAQLEATVLDRAREVRAIIFGQSGNLENEEKLLSAAISARQSYLKKKYSSDQRLSRLYDDESNQKQRIQSWMSKKVSTFEGIVSFYCDGYEYTLNASNYADYDPPEIRAFINGKKPDQKNSKAGQTIVYRMVHDDGWYVLMLVDDEDWNPREGSSFELMLQGYENTTVRATVESYTRSGGELLVRLRVEDAVKPVLYTRTCTAELGDFVQMLTVPSRALYTQDGMQGVVVLDGTNRIFVQVDLYLQQDGFAYITSVQPGLLYEGQTVVLF